MVRNFLDEWRRRPHSAWVGLLLYAAAVTFPHEQVQVLVGHIADLLTRPGLYRVSAAVAIALAAGLTAILFYRLGNHPRRRRIAVFWILTLALIWCTWRIFTANNTELLHYPQYFPEGAALLAITLSPTESLAWITLFGGLDEAYQYWVLYPRRVTALDFNDVYMDLLGGAAGVVFAASFLTCRSSGTRRRWRRPGIVLLLAVIAVGILLGISGRMALRQDDPRPHWFALSREKTAAFWSIVPASGPRYIHELTPPEGIALILATISIYAALLSESGEARKKD